MYKIALLLFFCLHYSFVTNAQIHIQGITKDVHGDIIKYVNVGFEGKEIGTVSNQDGIFSLTIPDALENELLTFSHINYTTIQLFPGELNDNETIILEEAVKELPEIIINPSKITSKWLKKGFKIPGRAELKGLGGDWGTSWKIKKNCILKQIRFEVSDCTYDSVVVRINVYAFNSNTQAIGESYLQSPLYRIIKANNKNAEYYIEILDDIQLSVSEVFVSFGVVQYYGEGRLNFPVCSGAGYIREVCMAKLEKISFNPGISALVCTIH